MHLLRKAAAVLLVILICVMALAILTKSRILRRGAKYIEVTGTGLNAADLLVFLGGATDSIIVDTLNLTHWLRRDAPLKKVDLCHIIETIDTTAPILRSRYSDRIIYVTKTRETRVSAEETRRMRAVYQAASRRNSVYISVVDQLPGLDAEPRGHPSLGRDDFYMIMLAQKLNCPVLSRDKYRDLALMKSGELGKFQVITYVPTKDLPERDYVNPSAAEFRRLRRPKLVDYSAVFDV